MKARSALLNINGNIPAVPRILSTRSMIIRLLILFFFAATLATRASDPIAAPLQGASASVTQPHVVAELIPESTTVQPGQTFDVALHLHMDPNWHTYWINPGDAGLATTIKWTLPPGFTAGPIQWPTPEKHNMGPLITYGYGGDVYLLTTITAPKGDLPQHFDVKAKATWLVCQEECIPGKAELTLPMDSGLMNLRLPQENKDFFEEARARLPVPNGLWKVTGSYGPDALVLSFHEVISAALSARNVYFFPEQPNVLSAVESSNPSNLGNVFTWKLALQQNGDKPDHLSGVIVSDSTLTGANGKSVYISEFPVSPAAGAGPAAGSGARESNGNDATGALRSQPGSSVSDTSAPVAGPATATTATATMEGTLIAVLGAAFLGGLILNLMPCVLPVLSLKVFSLMRHAGENSKTAWIQGLAFTVGVLLSFWALAGLLLILRTAGNHLGWGFQMQSPGFVFFLVLLFFLLALNLFGVFELGSSLVGLDAKATGHLGGLASSFGNGALATLAATPCTAPFMGSALGFAAQQPAYISLLIFTFLALGMATPYLLLTLFPGALRFVPKPGAWMEAFKQFMGFLLMATVIFLVYVFGALVGEDEVPWLLFVLLLAGVAAWIYGRWSGPTHATPVRVITLLLALGLIAFAVSWGARLASEGEVGTVAGSATATPNREAGDGHRTPLQKEDWQPWTPSAVEQELAQGRPVFVDFTAAWCLSCKVNERVALDTDAVNEALAQKNVALFRADWTHSDPAISQTLQQFNRDGVPLYLLYSPQNKKAPQVLPEVLTPGIVLDALQKL
jgi:thiol:disulfide interchange protein/DsbC/DsbD-like thiol-disulfide interchange protein